MPNWSSELPSSERHMGYDLVRTPQTGSLQTIVTSDNLLVCDTHYWGGRTTPCERRQLLADGTSTAGNCPACNEGIPYRAHVYISAFSTKTGEHVIFECTAHAAKPLAEYFASTGTLRGCVLTASRPKGHKNAKVVIQTNTANLSRIMLPEPPNIIRALAVIWRLPTTAFDAPAAAVGSIRDRKGYAASAPTIQTRAAALDRQRQQPANAAGPQSIGEIISGNGKGKPVPDAVQ